MGDIALAALSTFAVASLNVGFGADGLFSFDEIAIIANVGGITSVLQGGKFGHGFISAGIGAAVGGSRLLRGAKFGEQIAVRSVVGGTLSEITGGKFANGAVTAAFAYAIASAARNGLPGKDGTANGVATEQENLTQAEAEFRMLYDEGLLPKEFDFINDLEGGIDNPALKFEFVDRVVPGRVAEQDIYNYTGATVYRGGATTLTVALDTVAHEIFHLEPRNQAFWKDGGFGKTVAQQQAIRNARKVVEIWEGNRK